MCTKNLLVTKNKNEVDVVKNEVVKSQIHGKLVGGRWLEIGL